jgi:hypothetical protein
MNRLPIDSLLGDLRHGVGGTIIARIIDSEDTIALTASQENPMATIVDIGNDAVTLRETVADLTLGGALHTTVAGDTEGVDFAPDARSREIGRESKESERQQIKRQGGRDLTNRYRIHWHSHRCC